MSDSATSWTAAHQAPLSMGFSRQEYWMAISFSRGSSPPGIRPRSRALQTEALPSEPPGKPISLFMAKKSPCSRRGVFSKRSFTADKVSCHPAPGSLPGTKVGPEGCDSVAWETLQVESPSLDEDSHAHASLSRFTSPWSPERRLS